MRIAWSQATGTALDVAAVSLGQPVGTAESAPAEHKELVDEAQGSLPDVSLQASLLPARATSTLVGWGPA